MSIKLPKGAMRWSIVGIVIIAGAYFGYQTFVPQENEELSATPANVSKPKKELVVRSMIVTPRELTDAITISGTLLPEEETNLAFETSGKITEIYFKEGQRVSKGQLLAKLNDATLQANLKRLKAQQQLTEDRLRRQRVLLEKEAVSREAFQEAEVALMTLMAEIEHVEAQIKQTELRAPFDGTLGLRQVSVGEFVNTSQAVTNITAVNRLKIEFAIPERYANQLGAGKKLTFTCEGDNLKRSAEVYATDSHVDTDTRTLKVRAIYENPSGTLVPGRYVQVTLTAQHFAETLAVPSEAIISEMGIDKVFLYDNGVARPVQIQKGLRTASDVQVLSGIEVGDTVITSGTMQLRTGMKVKLSN